MVNAILDSGAGCSVIDSGSLEEIGLKGKLHGCTTRLVNASGENMDIIGSVNIQVTINGLNPVVQEFKVLNNSSYNNILLGRDFMKLFGSVEFDFASNKVRLGAKTINCVGITANEKVRLSEKTVIPARSEQVVNVRCKKKYSQVDVDFEPLTLHGNQGIFASKARVLPNIHGMFQITILNVTETDIVLHNRRIVGVLHSTELQNSSCESINRVIEQSSTQMIKFGENLNQDQRRQLTELIHEYKDVFAENPKKPKCTTMMEHRIITEGALPVRSKPRRIPNAWEKEVNDQLQEMLGNNIIRPSSSPWNAPFLLVKKKDQGMRFVCDFRGLNDVTKKDNYPLPHIRDVIDKMDGSKFFSTLDAAAAYWSMPLREEDKEKTAFSAPRGKYEFNVTPYGLCNAGASYQRLMDACLSGLPPDRILAYMDDIAIFSPTFEEHLSDLVAVFKRLRAANITLKVTKCVLASNRVELLGYELSPDGIKPQQRLTQAIRDFARPTNRKEVKRFLGLVGFYRSFIGRFGDICKPLNSLTSDNVVFNWDSLCEEAFNELKQKLQSRPILAFPRLGENFIVDVDSSDQAFGGVLMQYGDDNELHPVAYFSDAVQSSQKNWSPTTKEAYALVLAVRHWHVYLAGQQFILNTDHNPLVYMRAQKDPRGKFARWILELEEYDYSIQYVPGLKNVKADPLSRNSAATDHHPTSPLDDNIYHLNDLEEKIKKCNLSAQMKEEQDADPIISNVKRSMLDGVPILKGRLKRVQKQLRIENDILTKSGRPVVPASLRSYILSAIHDIAHFKVDKTYDLLRTRFYWPSMYQCTKSFIESCETCQKTQCDTNPPKAPLVPMFIPTAPMEFVALDIAHMPVDPQGYRYFLLIGDVFSKYIQAVALRDQTAPIVIKALSNSWIYFHGTPFYVLSDQGSNVDGDTVRELCNTLGIEKRRSSAYHSQGNGFAERNIRTVKEVLRAVLLDRKMDQRKWRQILPELTFALNCSMSTATKCNPYNVVFGRQAVLPIDVQFGLRNVNPDMTSPLDYQEEVTCSLNDVFSKVVEHLGLSKLKMEKQYNRTIRFNDYSSGSKVWLKVKFYKTGENRKLSPRRNGPWTVIEKLPNGVNFRISNDKTREEKVVHHDRLTPAKTMIRPTPTRDHEDRHVIEYSSGSSSDSDSGSEDEYDPTESDSSSSDNPDVPPDHEGRRYPLRARQQRLIPGSIPWSALDNNS